MNELGELLRSLRGKKSLREVADKADISHNYLSIIEKGIDPRSGSPVKPTPETLKSLSKAYNYSYENLMKSAGYLSEEIKEDGAIYDTSDPFVIFDLVDRYTDEEIINKYLHTHVGEKISPEIIRTHLAYVRFLKSQQK